jgi:hypothetical protein
MRSLVSKLLTAAIDGSPAEQAFMVIRAPRHR